MTTAKKRIESERLAREAEAIATYNKFLESQNDNKNFLIVENFADITAQTKQKIICVNADETNENLPTVYFFDSTGLQWIPSVGV